MIRLSLDFEDLRLGVVLTLIAVKWKKNSTERRQVTYLLQLLVSYYLVTGLSVCLAMLPWFSTVYPNHLHLLCYIAILIYVASAALIYSHSPTCSPSSVA